MDIKLYHNNSLSNVVNKSITLVSTSSSAKFLEPYDEYAPVIRYRGKTNFDDVNYISVEQSGSGGFTRYYFLENVTYKSPNIALLTCRLDVLKTYSSFISGLECYLSRSGNKGDLYLPDTRPTLVYNNVEKLSFRDSQNKIEGFVVPGETAEEQKNNGYFVYTTLQTGYLNSNTPWPAGYTPISDT